MRLRYLGVPLLLLCCTLASAQITKSIKVDQFGYLPDSTKIAVLSDPQTGFNSTDSYTPGTSIQVRTVPGSAVVFTALPQAWNGGATHAQSGDKVWWVDFSQLKTPGTYQLFDPATSATSDTFRIGSDVYTTLLTQATRMFYYQRSGFAKAAPYTDPKWADGAAFLGTNQDPTARSVLDQANATTARDLRGGWFDAGDYNKYTVFTARAVLDLLLAYEQHPSVFRDTTGIPESGNGIPDILDEVKWALDWLLRMQTATGDGSVLSKVSAAGFTMVSPPSADTTPRYWGAASTSSTAATAAAFALGAIQFGRIGQVTYATTLRNAAESAWTWAQAHPAVDFVNTGFGSVNPDPCNWGCPYGRLMEQIGAAVYLYALTGTTTYRTFVDTNYTSVQPIMWGFWYATESAIQNALLYYTKATGATAATVSTIQMSKTGSLIGAGDFLPAIQAATDAYRAYLADANYVWGSNMVKAQTGLLYADMIHYGLDTGFHGTYRTVAGDYLHYVHGVNPLALAYLTNMNAFGATRSATQTWHIWFQDGSIWDQAGVSANGPAPGYLTGGPNPSYSGNQTPPLGQPVQKFYLDSNTLASGANMYEISEPSDQYQAAYVRLLAAQIDCLPPGCLCQ